MKLKCITILLLFITTSITAQISISDSPRGNIYDAKGRPLTNYNSEKYASIIPAAFLDADDKKNAIAALASILQISGQQINSILENSINNHDSVPIGGVLTSKQVKAIMNLERAFPAIMIQFQATRNYLYGKRFAHITGYLKKVSEAEIDRYMAEGYAIGDVIGTTGVEQQYDNELQDGRNIHLTLDAEIQKIVYQNFNVKSGAAIMLDATNGDVLALVSKPDFDANVMLMSRDNVKYKKLMKVKKSPFLNRVIAGTYPPGSVFKPVIATSALENKIIDSKTTYNCNGKYKLGKNSRTFHCHKKKGHGKSNVVQAIGRSCNVFFYNLAYATKIKNISATATKLGFGQITGIDIPFERTGIIPTEEWRNKRGGSWFAGETVLIGIGQGPVSVTPLQMASFYQTVAAHGKRFRPRVVKEISGDFYGQKIDSEILGENLISESTLKQIKAGMLYVTTKGTAYSSFRHLPKIKVLGKTGTAEVFHGAGKKRYAVKHTWFAAIAPADKPKIVLIILVENGESGEKTAAPIAKNIISDYIAMKK